MKSMNKFKVSAVFAICTLLQVNDTLVAKTTEGMNSMTMIDDLKVASGDINWPPGYSSRTADIFAHNEILINAPCERVWKRIVAAKEWDRWYPNARDVRFDGSASLGLGTIFTWKTFGLSVTSRVEEFVPGQRLGWTGAVGDKPPAFFHTWLLSPAGAGCAVITEEVGMGLDAKSLREANEGLLHRGHDLWLATLKWASEDMQD